jgi:hypothetical protein
MYNCRDPKKQLVGIKKALFANQSAKIGNRGRKSKSNVKTIAKVNSQEMKAIPIFKLILQDDAGFGGCAGISTTA